MSRPASIRLAMAISPSRDSSSTLPISRKYMRTGSSVRPRLASSTLPVASSLLFLLASAFSTLAAGASPSSFSSLSTTWMPISLSIGHHVFDLLGAVLLRGQDGVQLVEGDVAALLALRDQALDGDGVGIEQGCCRRPARPGQLRHGHGIGLVAIGSRAPPIGLPTQPGAHEQRANLGVDTYLRVEPDPVQVVLRTFRKADHSALVCLAELMASKVSRALARYKRLPHRVLERPR